MSDQKSKEGPIPFERSSDVANKEQFAKLMQIDQDKRKIKTELLEATLKEHVFPEDKMPAQFRDLALKAMINAIPITMKAPLQDFNASMKALLNYEPITLANFRYIANCFDAVRPTDLPLSPAGYTEFLDEVFGMISTWEQKLKSINLELDLKVEAEWKMKEKLIADAEEKRQNARLGLKMQKGEA